MIWPFSKRNNLIRLGPEVAVDPATVEAVYRNKDGDLIIRVGKTSAFTLYPEDLYEGGYEAAIDKLTNA